MAGAGPGAQDERRKDRSRRERKVSEQSTTQPGAPQETAPPIRRLTRRRDGKVIAGVCTGLGEYTGVDPIVFRILFIVLSFLGGSGFVVYIAAWLLMPEGPDAGPSRGERIFDRLR